MRRSSTTNSASTSASNQRAGVASPGLQLHLWGFFHAPKTHWREQLKALLNPNGSATRPVKVMQPDSLEATCGVRVKSTFNRRVSYRKANLIGRIAGTRDQTPRGDRLGGIDSSSSIALVCNAYLTSTESIGARCTAETTLDLANAGASRDPCRASCRCE